MVNKKLVLPTLNLKHLKTISLIAIVHFLVNKVKYFSWYANHYSTVNNERVGICGTYKGSDR